MTRVRVPFLSLTAVALAVAPVVLLGGGAPAWAEDPPNIVWSAKVDPDRVAAGEKGVLVITGAIRKKVHVYADKRFRVKPTAVAGVTYGLPEKAPPTKWQDPTDKEAAPEEVYLESVVVKVPFTLAADAKLPLTVSASIEWSCCDDEQCFGKETTKPPPGAEIKAPEGKEPPPTPPAAAAAPSAGSDPVSPTPSPSAPESVASPPPAAAPPAGAPAAAAPAASPRAFRASTTIKTDDVTATVVADEKQFKVTFAPSEGMVVHPLGGEGAVVVKGVAGAHVSWGTATAPSAEPEIHDPYEVAQPYTSSGDESLSILVSWTACDTQSGVCHIPEAPHRVTLTRKAATPTLAEGMDLSPIAPAASNPSTTAAAVIGSSAITTTVASTGLLFPVVGKGSTGPEDEPPKAFLLLLLSAFGSGVLLSFTPCVLPLLPITISLIGGGRADLKKGRLATLLLTYVMGLSIAFGVMGLAAAQAGASFAAAFQSPIALWIISGVFIVLSFGMFGVFELQPPQWAQRLQGGTRGGNAVGAFLLGGMGALIASPCTGPFIAGLVVVTAKSGNLLLGFSSFFTIGLGMGAVLFAAGSLNMLAKPGPWMVWVRHGLGVFLVAVALFYLRSADKVSTNGLVAIGFAVAVLVALGIARHLIKREGSDKSAAYTQGVRVAGLIVLATGALAFVMRAQSSDVTWKTATSREQLVAEVERAKQDGKSTVVDFWGEWCHNCKAYDHVIDDTPDVKQGFLRLHRVRVDLTNEDRPWETGVRDGLGVPPQIAPFMVFIDTKGRIHRNLDIRKWHGSDAASELEKRLRAIEHGAERPDDSPEGTKTSSARMK